MRRTLEGSPRAQTTESHHRGQRPPLSRGRPFGNEQLARCRPCRVPGPVDRGHKLESTSCRYTHMRSPLDSFPWTSMRIDRMTPAARGMGSVVTLFAPLAQGVSGPDLERAHGRGGFDVRRNPGRPCDTAGDPKWVTFGSRSCWLSKPPSEAEGVCHRR
jgi:hypothetical protein